MYIGVYTESSQRDEKKNENERHTCEYFGLYLINFEYVWLFQMQELIDLIAKLRPGVLSAASIEHL